MLVSGVVDSFGLALGWTLVVLIATARGGLAEAALYNAAMLVGVVLSAPVTGWLARHLDGRVLLRGAAGIEVMLRFGTLFGLIAGWPAWLIAVLVAVQHVAAWAGFAGMRAEVSAVDSSARSMTRYAVSIAGVEAAGTALAALLPVGPHGYPTGGLLIAVFVVYLGSLLPTVLVARRARIAPAPSVPVSFTWRLPQPRLLLAGAGVMLLASGPALLAVPVTAELHGDRWVAVAAIAFCAGTLLATRAVTALGRLHLPAVLRWSLWGLGMLAGWILAPHWAPLVLLAQFAAGLSQTAFEGDMDARVAVEARPESVTRDLAYSASVRALGGAVAVRLLPMLYAAPAIGLAASAASLILGVITLLLWAALTVAPHLFRRTDPVQSAT
ncbi:hypothetical protein KOI35_03875 [Actinoplanes bogorensis]|uniref:MFS transporter n=1 Tax=Paractinoplanes bogorensis TaxID=1610840 RepID=A0ABS5YGT9_9ACTN|nr:hypothetical protein [Actinoplanes bogorensis]